MRKYQVTQPPAPGAPGSASCPFLSSGRMRSVFHSSAADLASASSWFREAVELRKPTLQAMVEGWIARHDSGPGIVADRALNPLVATQSTPGGE
jgi:hypothetical protein